MDVAEYTRLVMQNVRRGGASSSSSSSSLSSSSSSEYAALVLEVQHLKGLVKAACPRAPNGGETPMVLVFVDRDEAVNELVSSNPNAFRGFHVVELLQEADIFLMYEHNVEIKCLEKSEGLGEYVSNVSNCLKEMIVNPVSIDPVIAHYKKPKVPTELLKDAAWMALPKEQRDLRWGWICMLMSIPGVSQRFATWIAQKYSCPRALLDAYARTPGDRAKALLLQHEFQGTRKNVTDKMEELSERVYRLLTGKDPSVTIFGLEEPT